MSVNIKADDDCCAFASRTSQGEPIGIDLGIGKFAVLSDGRSFENINKQKRIKLLEKRVDRLQRSLSRKEKDEADKNSGRSKNYDQTKFQLEQTYYRLHNIRSDFINKAVKKIVETNPRYIAIEDLKITEMVQERMFSRSISLQMFYEFRKRLIRKCLNDGIEIRVVDRWYPSSKRCHNCGRVKNRLLHSERVYECECGYKADRDFNASLNIRDAEKYHRVTVYP